MALLISELLIYESESMSDASTNGGRMTADAITSDVKNNVWPDTTSQALIDGATYYRKIHLKAASADDSAFQNVKVYTDSVTPGDDRQLFFLGTATDTQADITGSERVYGGAETSGTTGIGAGSITATTPAEADGSFQDGDTVRIQDGANVEFLEVSTAVYTGDSVVLTLTGTTEYAYPAGSIVSSIIPVASVSGTWDSWTGSSTSGVYGGGAVVTDVPTTNTPLVTSIGGVEQTWTITFTSATEFTVVGDTLGSVATGDIATDLEPDNPDFSTPYFTMAAAGWGGSWQAGDFVTFETHPAAIPLWLKRIIPAGSTSTSSNESSVGWRGESA